MSFRRQALANKNLNPPPDPFELEDKEKELRPTNQWVEEQVDKWFAEEEAKVQGKANLSETERFATQSALKMLRLNRTLDRLGGVKEKQFKTDFDSWLVGAGRVEDSKKTPWGRIPLKLPDVAVYVRSHVDKRLEFTKKLAHLRLTGPTTLLESWLYYK